MTPVYSAHARQELLAINARMTAMLKTKKQHQTCVTRRV